MKAPTSEAESATEKEILEAAEVKRTVGQDALRRLIDDNVITRIGEGKRGDPYRYWTAVEKVSAATTYAPAERNDEIGLDHGVPDSQDDPWSERRELYGQLYRGDEVA